MRILSSTLARRAAYFSDGTTLSYCSWPPRWPRAVFALLKTRNWLTVIVHVEADYLGPAAFYDLLRISVATARLGRSSLHLDYRVINAGNDQEIFTARMVMVQVDLATETSRPWSTAFREALIGYHGQQVLQS